MMNQHQALASNPTVCITLHTDLWSDLRQYQLAQQEHGQSVTVTEIVNSILKKGLQLNTHKPVTRKGWTCQ
jgi:hypothetical protein